MLRPPATRQRRRWLGPVLATMLAVTTFALGLAVGQALEQGTVPEGTRTDVRTLVPTTVSPPARTVTTTVERP